MTSIELIQTLKDSKFVDEDGGEYALDFAQGLTESEIDQLRTRFPKNHIADELVEVLKVTKGWDGYGPEMVYFDSIGQFGFSELAPFSLSLGGDGFGNFWILDVHSDGTLGKVWYACHDPAVFVIHSQNLNEYLTQLLEFYGDSTKSHLQDVHEEVVFSIWGNDQSCQSKSDFIAENADYADFLSQFEGDDWTVADLRKGQNKMGFAWGKFGANAEMTCHPSELIWIIKNKKKGFFARLFN